MKALRWIAWVSAAVAVVILIIAFISFCSGKLIFHVAHGETYFDAASSLLLLAIALFIGTKHCCCKSSECKDDKKEG
jgi:ABC-type multidrug transport system permease subunit